MRFHPSPVREFAGARSADLICQQLDGPVLNAVIVRFNEPILGLIAELHEVLRFDGSAEKTVNPASIVFTDSSKTILRGKWGASLMKLRTPMKR
jgi:hypothetical protein